MKMLVILLVSWLLLAMVVHGVFDGPGQVRTTDCVFGFPCAESLHVFPPGRPQRSNIGNICARGRRGSEWAEAATNLSPYFYQVKAMFNLEEGLGRCCRRPQGQRLKCSQATWEKVLTQFCEEELSVLRQRIRPPFFCCEKPEGQDRFACFANRAPFPGYDKKARVDHRS